MSQLISIPLSDPETATAPSAAEPLPSVALASSRIHQDAFFMAQAIKLAELAAQIGEVPVGAVVVRRGEVIAKGFNLRETMRDPLAHAEVLALREAAHKLKSWRLLDCELYVTLEPCVMCAGAAVHSRLLRLIFGAHDPKAGAVRTLYRIADDQRLNHRVAVTEGVLADPSSQLLRDFFSAIRLRRTRGSDPQIVD